MQVVRLIFLTISYWKSGYGRYDVITGPLNKTGKAFVFEFKVQDVDEDEETIEVIILICPCADRGKAVGSEKQKCRYFVKNYEKCIDIFLVYCILVQNLNNKIKF